MEAVIKVNLTFSKVVEPIKAYEHEQFHYSKHWQGCYALAQKVNDFKCYAAA